MVESWIGGIFLIIMKVMKLCHYESFEILMHVQSENYYFRVVLTTMITTIFL